MDGLLARKHAEVAAAIRHCPTVPKKLRVYLFTTHSNQPGAVAAAAAAAVPSAPASQAVTAPGGHSFIKVMAPECRLGCIHAVPCQCSQVQLAAQRLEEEGHGIPGSQAAARQRGRTVGPRLGPSTCTGGCWSRRVTRRRRACRPRRSPSATTCAASGGRRFPCSFGARVMPRPCLTSEPRWCMWEAMSFAAAPVQDRAGAGGGGAAAGRGAEVERRPAHQAGTRSLRDQVRFRLAGR